MELLFLSLTGISYLSRVQEAAAKVRIGNPIPSSHVKILNSTPSVADKIFVERIKSRVKNWKSLCQKSSSKTDGKKYVALEAFLIRSLFYSFSSYVLTFSISMYRFSFDDLKKSYHGI